MPLDMLEKISRSFGSWYEGLFGGGDDVRPKDILRRILGVLEDNRKEGFDNKTYVPNQYILEINVTDEEEKEYLLSFLDRHELESAIRRYCQQNRYQIRGALEFIIKEGEPEAEGENRPKEKIRIRCRYTTKANTEPPRIPTAVPVASSGDAFPYEENPTVANMAQEFTFEEVATLLGQASANLTIHPAAGVPYQFGIHKPALTIGRSSRAGNDLVLQGDGLVSKRHARVEREADGNYTLYDLGSTNGVKVNGNRVDNYTLQPGDEFTIGNTRIVFEAKQKETTPSFYEQASPATSLLEEPIHRSGGIFGGAAASLMEGGGSSSPPTRRLRPQTGRLQRLDERGDVIEEFTLGSETLIGRGITNDIVLPDRSVATRHACLLFDTEFYTIEALTDSETTLNAVPLDPRLPIRLTDGDVIGIGSLRLRFLLVA
jgi:pSer/pThr/pTyr-binding forkhead associated (FHA) protein